MVAKTSVDSQDSFTNFGLNIWKNKIRELVQKLFLEIL